VALLIAGTKIKPKPRISDVGDDSPRDVIRAALAGFIAAHTPQVSEGEGGAESRRPLLSIRESGGLGHAGSVAAGIVRC